MNRMIPSKNITSTPSFWNLPQWTFGSTQSLDVISCLRSSFLNYNGRCTVFLKEPIIFSPRVIRTGASLLVDPFCTWPSLVSSKYTCTQCPWKQTFAFFLLSKKVFILRLHQPTCLTKITQPIPLVSFHSTLASLLAMLILYEFWTQSWCCSYIYIYRHWIRAFFWQWLFFGRLRLFDRFSRLISSRQYFNSDLQSRTCVNSFRNATLLGGSHSSRICPASSVSSDKKSSRQVVATSSTRDSWPSAWMDADALVRHSSFLWSDCILSIFLFNISGFERFWQNAFAWLFRPFLAEHGHLWTLDPTELPPLSVDWPWHFTTHLAKVRFQCQVISLAFSYSSSDFHFLV